MVLGAILIWCSYDLPEIGLATAPIHLHIVPDYILGSKNDIGIPNIVTSILASYRGYDTFGEVIVIFTAGIAVLTLLQNVKKEKKNMEKKYFTSMALGFLSRKLIILLKILSYGRMEKQIAISLMQG